MVANDKIKEIVDTIVRTYDPEQVILFGSHAWGKPSPDSDVDLCIIKKSRKNRRQREFELRKKLYPPDVAMDLLVLTPEEIEQRLEMNDFFVREIVNRGKKMYDAKRLGK